MMYIKRLDNPSRELLMGADKSLVSEHVLVTISRLGFRLSYQPKPKAEWESFPPQEITEEERLRSPCCCAMADDQMVGVARVTAGSYLWGRITDLRVDPAFRRIGAGKALLDACEAWAVEQGHVGLSVQTGDNNPIACQFLEHCGFTLGGMDRMAMSQLPGERDKPIANRPCLLIFYRKAR